MDSLHCHMVVEQTRDFPMRMRYDPNTRTFTATERRSLAFERGFTRPYGWIKASGTPPAPHWDVILMSERTFTPGEEVPVRVVGVFRRADGDHKLIAVEQTRKIAEYEQLEDEEKIALHRLYPRVGAGEGWFGAQEALRILTDCEKPL